MDYAAYRSDGEVAPIETTIGLDASGYDRIKQLKKDLRRKGVKVNVPDLLALTKTNDPFYAGSAGNRKIAEWFVTNLNMVGLNIPGVHLRQGHYRLMSQDPPPTLWTGKTYVNDKHCAGALNCASKAARYLGLVDVENFDDRRNPDPVITMDAAPPADEPSWMLDTEYWSAWELPTIKVELDDDLDWLLPEPEVSGYTYRQTDQPAIVEVWIEKSTMENVLLPVCRQLAANYVSGIGFQSITGALRALKRVRQFALLGNPKPMRIFYISDFDPAGMFMPDGVARQIEYWLDQYAPGADIRLTPLALTHEQVKHFNLPTTPIKSTDKRMKKFCERWGVDGAVELDALEALKPGKLAKIVRDAITPYRDKDLRDRMGDAEEEAVEMVESAWNPHKTDFNERLKNLKSQARQILEPFKAELESIAGRLADAFAESDLEKDIAQLRADVRKTADEMEIELPERPAPEYAGNDDAYWLYDSKRDYLTQLTYYKERRNGADDDEDDCDMEDAA